MKKMNKGKRKKKERRTKQDGYNKEGEKKIKLNSLEFRDQLLELREKKKVYKLYIFVSFFFIISFLEYINGFVRISCIARKKGKKRMKE